MKKYVNPEIEVIEILNSDIITSSPGTQTGLVDETDGDWELGINP